MPKVSLGRFKWAVIFVPLIALLAKLLADQKKILDTGLFGNGWIAPHSKEGLFTPSYQCHNQAYTVEILSIDPFVMYMNNFLSDAEVDYLLKWSWSRFTPAVVLNEKGEFEPDTKSISDAATLPRHDPVSECLTARMKSVLGNLQHIDTEPIRIVKYEGGPENNYKLQSHTDWVPFVRNKTWNPEQPFRPNNRLGSIFAYIEDDCDGGETYFPQIQGIGEDGDGDKFARTESGLGLLVKPRRGNAIFWNNLFSNGSGDPRTLHAGLPVSRGTKIGVNIWSHYFLDAPFYG